MEEEIVDLSKFLFLEDHGNNPRITRHNLYEFKCLCKEIRDKKIDRMIDATTLAYELIINLIDSFSDNVPNEDVIFNYIEYVHKEVVYDYIVSQMFCMNIYVKKSLYTQNEKIYKVFRDYNDHFLQDSINICYEMKMTVLHILRENNFSENLKKKVL